MLIILSCRDAFVPYMVGHVGDRNNTACSVINHNFSSSLIDLKSCSNDHPPDI